MSGRCLRRRQRGAAKLCGANFGRREYCPEGPEDRPRTRPVVLGDPRAFPLLAAWVLFRGDQAALMACEQMCAIELVRQCCPETMDTGLSQPSPSLCSSPACLRSAAARAVASTPTRCARSSRMTFAARSWTRQRLVCVASSLRSAVSGTDADWRDTRMEDDEIDDDGAFCWERSCAALRNDRVNTHLESIDLFCVHNILASAVHHRLGRHQVEW